MDWTRTRFRRPNMAEKVLVRPRIAEELQSCRLAALVGPAGCGKTTALEQRPGAWLNVSADDSEPSAFFLAVVAVLEKSSPGCLQRTREAIHEGLDLHHLQLLFVNELNAGKRPLSLIMDDYHLVPPQHWIRFLFSHGPPNLSLAIASRLELNLDLARLHAQGELVLLDYRTLRFTPMEGQQLFERWGIALAHGLVERLDGWIAGLSLVAYPLARKSIDDGEERIAIYLEREVLAMQPPAIQQFMLATSHPDGFSLGLAGYLCQALSPEAGVAHLLGRGLFLERHEGSFHYAPFFRAFLQSKMPAPSARIAAWFLECGEWSRGVLHLLQVDSPDELAELLSRYGSRLLLNGLALEVEKCLRMLPLGMRSRTNLQNLQADVSQRSSGWEVGQEQYRRAARICLVHLDMAGWMAALEGLAYGCLRYGEPEKLEQICAEALLVCPRDSSNLKSILQGWLGAALVYRGAEWSRARQLLQESHQAAQGCDERTRCWSALTYGYAYSYARGDHALALVTLAEGVELARRTGLAMLGYQLVSAHILVQLLTGEHGAAQEWLEETIASATAADHHFILPGLESLRAMTFLKRRQPGMAASLLERVDSRELTDPLRLWLYRNRALSALLLDQMPLAGRHLECMRQALPSGQSGLEGMEYLLLLALLQWRDGQAEQARGTLQAAQKLSEGAEARFWSMKVAALKATIEGHRWEPPVEYLDYWRMDPLGLRAAQSQRRVPAKVALEIHAFGSLQLSVAGRPIDYAEEIRPAGVRLLKFLLSSSVLSTPTELLLDLFWPDLPPERARNNLSVQLSGLRRVLRTPDLFRRKGDSCDLCFDKFGYDVAQFERLSQLGQNLRSRGSCAEAIEAYLQAERLQSSPFLSDDPYDDWILLRRGQLERQDRENTRTLADLFFEQGGVEEAAKRYQRIVDGEHPSDEVFLQLCRCYHARKDALALRGALCLYQERVVDQGAGWLSRATLAEITRMFDSLA